MATATSLGNVGSTPHSSADLRVGTAVALASSVASSVAKYWVLTNLFTGPLPQVSVYHHSHHNSSHRSGGGGEASSKEPASSLNQEMALTSSSHHQSTAPHHHHQPSVSSSSSHHSSLPSNPQVCQCSGTLLRNDQLGRGLQITDPYTRYRYPERYTYRDTRFRMRLFAVTCVSFTPKCMCTNGRGGTEMDVTTRESLESRHRKSNPFCFYRNVFYVCAQLLYIRKVHSRFFIHLDFALADYPDIARRTEKELNLVPSIPSSLLD